MPQRFLRRGMVHHNAVDRPSRRTDSGLALIETLMAHLRALGIERTASVCGVSGTPSAKLKHQVGLEPGNINADCPA